MQRTKPPFRADMVGSLLRTAALKDARHKHHEGEISDAALKEIEDREIRALIKRQEEIGLQAVTDGEFRRAYLAFRFPGASRRRHLCRGRFRHELQGRRRHREGVARDGQGRILRPTPDDRPFPLREGQHRPRREDDDPRPEHAALPRRAEDDEHGRLSEHGRLLCRCRQGLQQGRACLLRCRLPLPSARRHLLRLSLRSGAARDAAPARRRSGEAARDLCRHGARGAQGQAGRPDDHDASVPRQLPLDLHRLRRL